MNESKLNSLQKKEKEKMANWDVDALRCLIHRHLLPSIGTHAVCTMDKLSFTVQTDTAGA